METWNPHISEVQFFAVGARQRRHRSQSSLRHVSTSPQIASPVVRTTINVPFLHAS